MRTEETTTQNEQMSAADEKIVGLLAALSRVEAPNDFDFRVRARIAAGRPADTIAFRLPLAVRYGVPLALLIAVGTYFGFTRFYALNEANVPSVVEDQQPVSPPGNDGIIVPVENSKDERAGQPSRDIAISAPR